VEFEFGRPEPGDGRASALRVLQELRRSVEAKPANAAAQLLLSTSIAAKFLRRTQRTSAAFPDPYLAGDALAIGNETKTMLSAYAEELWRLQDSAAVSSLPFATVAAPGFGVLASSVQAVAHASIMFLHEGRELWRSLLRGEPNFAYYYRKILDDHAIDEDIARDLFVPLMLVPDWPARSGAEDRRRGPRHFANVAAEMKNEGSRSPPAAEPSPKHPTGPDLQPARTANRRPAEQSEDKILQSIRAALTTD
jgi:hypothetical protein